DWLSSIATYVPLAALVFAWATALTCRLAARIEAHPLIFTAIPFAFLSVFGVLFSEAHLSWLSLAWLCLQVTRADSNRIASGVGVGIAAAACVLTRLDSAFTVGCILIWHGWR